MPLPEESDMINTREAFSEGKAARLHGMSKDENPYDTEQKELRNKWEDGWSIADSKIEAGMIDEVEVNHD